MTIPPNSEPDTTDTPKKTDARRAWWPRIVTFAKGVTGLAALGAAIVAILAWFPMARDFVDPRFKEYENLKSLYAGASVSFFDGKLGPASIVRAAPTEAGITERLYVKEDYIVQTLATPEGETKLYSVLSCNPNFKPSLNSFGGAVTLHDKPLAEQMRPGQDPQELNYLRPAVVINTVYFELAIDVSAPSHYRGYGYGVNTACSTGSGSESPPAPSVYEGPPSKAPQDIQDYRAKVPANFYVEAWDRPIRKLSPSGLPHYSIVTPLPENLPPTWSSLR